MKIQLRDKRGHFTNRFIDATGAIIKTSGPKKKIGKAVLSKDKKLIQKLKTKKQPIQTTKTYVGLVIDESGSMGNLKNSTIEYINNLIQSTKDNSAKFAQDSHILINTFSGEMRNKKPLQPTESIDILSYHEYNPGGMTALFDAVCQTIDQLDLKEDNKCSFLLYVITDGCENQSSTKNIKRITKLIQDKQATDRWTLVFNVPKGNASNFINQFGIPAGNVKEWDQTEQGLQDVGTQTMDSMQQYYTARSKHKTSLKNFYADMSNITTNQIKKKLTDVSSQFKCITVDHEIEIKDFVESKLNTTYKTGMAFFELTKPEIVQSYKDILVMKRGESKIYGGAEARQLLGLPDQDIKLNIKNLAEYRVFVKSTSVNRLLVRGTTLIVAK